GYSNLKQNIYYSPYNLLIIKGYITAALAVPTSNASGTTALRDKRKQLLYIIYRQATLENLDKFKLFT
ncbi:hypothetical protein LZ31DRAFT_475999, partial [Colletotrichum somersetense]